MSDDGATGAANGGETGEGAGGGENPVANAIPDSWRESEHFKGFYAEDGSFDADRFASHYAETISNQPAAPPEKPEDYTFTFGDVGVPYDEADAQLQREMAKEAGLTQSQYEAVVKHDLARLERITAEIEQETEKTRKALFKEWGGKAKYEANIAAAAKAAKTLFGEEFLQRVDLGNDPQLIRGLYHISQKLSEDSLRMGQGAASDNWPKGPDGQPRLTFPNSPDLER